jgi:hypothetical protein
MARPNPTSNRVAAIAGGEESQGGTRAAKIAAWHEAFGIQRLTSLCTLQIRKAVHEMNREQLELLFAEEESPAADRIDGRIVAC